MGKGALVCGLLAICLTPLTTAHGELDPLRQLPLLDAGFTGCPSKVVPHERIARLIARDSIRHDVGPYSVKLPGYTNRPSDMGHDSYAPFIIQACRGDTLRIALINQLPVQGTNLHEHGLVTPPTPDIPGPAGDYIFLELLPGHIENYRVRIPADLPGAMFGKTTLPQPYPSGLYWFHAHRHMFARNQVQGGEAGVLSIGNPLRVDYRDAQGKIVSQPLPPGTQVNYFALRDIQLAVPHGLRPVSATGQTARWLNGEDNLPDYDSTACEAKNNPWFSHGACGHDRLASGNTTDPSQDLVWLFTVNGQHFPQLTIAAGRPQLWRLANLSSNVTYVLEVAEGTDPEPGAPTLPFLAINLDGVVAGTPIENEPTELLGISLKRLLLMPGSRAEIFLPGENCARVTTLRTVGLQTGPGGNPAPTGDPWPPISLARLRTIGKPSCPAPSAGARELVARAPRPLGLDIRIPRRENSLSGPASGASAGAMLRASPNAASTSLAALHPGCRFLPEASAATAYRRRITFEQGDDGFKLGSEVVDGGGNPLSGSPAIPPEIYPASLNWATTPHICPVLGAQEVWELVNNTDEMHNFHIHQSKFRLADAALDKGVPVGLTAVVATGSSCATQPPTAAFCDPLGVIAGVVPEATGALPTSVDAWHDTIPVPPRDGNGNAGRVFVSIPFKAPEQEGRFVFHCHILEHEDGGMMAPIEVLSAASVIRQQQSEPMTMMSPMGHKH